MSNKMPESNGAKTESVPKSAKTILLLVLAAVFVLLAGVIAFSFLNDESVTINNKRLNVTVADSSSERERGLSGRERLSDKEGMLFIFDSDGVYCFWMKDMKFNIDMIWLDKDKKVIHIQENATPDSYPETFCPNQEARYVLEVGAGNARKLEIKRGDKATF